MSGVLVTLSVILNVVLLIAYVGLWAQNRAYTDTLRQLWTFVLAIGVAAGKETATVAPGQGEKA